MFRIDDPSASTTLPAPEAAGIEGFFTEGNPATGVPATLERASWFNMVQEELRAVVVAAGLAPSKTTYNQVLTAIQALIAPTGISQFASSKAGSGYQKLPSGLILQWGSFNVNDTANTATAYSCNFPTAFPTACAHVFLTVTNTIGTGSQPVVASVEGWSQALFNGYTYSGSSIVHGWAFLAIGY